MMGGELAMPAPRFVFKRNVETPGSLLVITRAALGALCFSHIMARLEPNDHAQDSDAPLVDDDVGSLHGKGVTGERSHALGLRESTHQDGAGIESGDDAASVPRAQVWIHEQ